MNKSDRKRGWKKLAVGLLRFVLRIYIRFSPWNTLKSAAYDKFWKYIAWRSHSAVTRTRYAFKMVTQVNDLIGGTIYLTGQWEPYITFYVRQTLRPGDIFIDVGANIGYYSLLASTLVGISGHVYSIEASTSIYKILLQNIRLNGYKNVTAINAAASDAAGEAVIWLASERNLGRSTTVSGIASAEEMQRESTVRADTIDKLVGPDVLKQARLVKVDVEGAERAVLGAVLRSPTLLGTNTEWLIELARSFLTNDRQDSDWIFDSFMALGYSAFTVPNGYDKSWYLARPQSAALTRVFKLPEEQVDVLFRPPGQANQKMSTVG